MKGSNRRQLQLLFRHLLFSSIFLVSNAYADFYTFYFDDLPRGYGITAEAACNDQLRKLEEYWDGCCLTYEGIVTSSSEVTDACSDDPYYATYPACLMGNGAPKGTKEYCTDVATVWESPPQDYTIEILPSDGLTEGGYLKMIEPANGGGISSANLVAVVKNDGGSIVSGINVRLEVDVQSNSGGHNHDDIVRHNNHAGSLSGTPVALNIVEGVTGPGGYNFTFGAPEVSGNHTIDASCVVVNCTQIGKNNVWVGIKNLVPLGTGNWVLIGQTGTHSGNHYMTSESVNRISAIANKYSSKFPSSPVLHLNDASLARGGLFDIKANWLSPHIEHRRGTVIDIRANEAAGAIPPENWEAFKRMVIHYGGISLLERSYNRLTGAEVVSNRHFHVRLAGRSE